MRRHREGGHQAERETRQKGGGDQNAVQGVVNAVADDDKDPRRGVPTVVVVMPVRRVVLSSTTVCMTGLMPMTTVVGLANLGAMTMVMTFAEPLRVAMRVPIRTRVPPQHQLFDEKNTPRPTSNAAPMECAPSGPTPSMASGSKASNAAPSSAPVA